MRKQKLTKKPTKKLTRGEKNIKWIEDYCYIPEGTDIGKPVKLRDWQCDTIRAIYDNKVKTRRAIISFGRKNAKTTLAAFLLLLHLCGRETKPNSQLYSAAQSRDQAAILFGLAAKIVQFSPDLRSVVVIRDTSKQLYCPECGTLYRALSAEASTAHGLSPTFIVHDELGQVRGPRSELYDALETATAAHRQPFSIIISTQAPHDGDLLSTLIDDALAAHDPHTVIALWTAPPDLDAFSDEAIKAANPAFGDFQNADEVRAMAATAKRMPAAEATYRNLVLNQRVASEARFVPPEVWKACGKEPQSIESTTVYGGLDLSATNDLTACVFIGQVGEVWQVHSTFWLPGEGIRERSMTDRVPYDLWAQQGNIETVPGKSVDYEYVAAWLREQFERYDIAKIAFDRWNFKNLKPWLLKVGFDEDEIARLFVEFGQGFQSMSPALRELEAALLNERIAHGNHPVLSMCAENAVVQSDPTGNRKLNKAKSIRRIDGMVALTMAFGVAHLEAEEAPSYDLFVLA